MIVFYTGALGAQGKYPLAAIRIILQLPTKCLCLPRFPVFLSRWTLMGLIAGRFIREALERSFLTSPLTSGVKEASQEAP